VLKMQQEHHSSHYQLHLLLQVWSLSLFFPFDYFHALSLLVLFFISLSFISFYLAATGGGTRAAAVKRASKGGAGGGKQPDVLETRGTVLRKLVDKGIELYLCAWQTAIANVDDASATMVLTDPPYGTSYNFN